MVEVNLFTSRAVYLENGESKPAFPVRKKKRLFIIKVLPPQQGVFARFYTFSNARARRVSNPVTWYYIYEQTKSGTENIIKVMLKALGLGRGITIKIIPKIKRMPRERITTLTLTGQRKPLVSNIIIQSPKRQPLMINIELIQRR